MRRWIVGFVVVVACGGGKGGGDGDGSGVAGDKVLSELTPDEVMTLCEYAIGIQPPPRTVMCPTGGDLVVDPGTVEECTSGLLQDQDSCLVTVDEIEACLEAIAGFTDAQVCDDGAFSEPACQPLLACAGGS